MQGVNDHDVQGLRSSLTLISMAAKQQPQLVADHLPLLLKVDSDPTNTEVYYWCYNHYYW